MRLPPTPTRSTAVLLLAGLAVTGCTDGGEPPTTPTATATGATPTPGATATSSPRVLPSPAVTTPAGPPPAQDGCPPPHDERAALPPVAPTVPSTAEDRRSQSPLGRPIDLRVATVTGSDAADAISATVRGRVDDVVAEWDAMVDQASEDSSRSPRPELQLEVAVTRVDERFVSFALTGFRYLGGAGVDQLTGAWTFATATGEQLTLADVGLDGACRDELGQLAADALERQDTGMFDEAAAALRAGDVSLQRWSLTEDAMRVHFAEYEVAPGAAGAPVAAIPLDDVRAATGSPLGADG